jgi:hypothetical protein
MSTSLKWKYTRKKIMKTHFYYSKKELVEECFHDLYLPCLTIS